jgi:5-methylcytosine-specific restriction endonuclease McrA
MLDAVKTDSEAVRQADDIWETRCIHCRARVAVTSRGEPLGSATLEHIVPRAWFRKRQPSELTRRLAGPDDPRNLALACARCNWGKGTRHDSRNPGDPRATAVVSTLLAKRLERFREDD